MFPLVYTEKKSSHRSANNAPFFNKLSLHCSGTYRTKTPQSAVYTGNISKQDNI